MHHGAGDDDARSCELQLFQSGAGKAGRSQFDLWHKGGLAVSEAVSIAKYEARRHCQLDQSEWRACALRGVDGKQLAEWLRELMGADDLCLTGCKQGAD
jgi:hypothetical protein